MMQNMKSKIQNKMSRNLSHLGILMVLLSSCARVDPPAEVINDATFSPYHTVARGETLSIIAKKYGMSKESLVRINQLKPPYKIFVGQSLLVVHESGKPSKKRGPQAEKKRFQPDVKPVTSVADSGEVTVQELPAEPTHSETMLPTAMENTTMGSEMMVSPMAQELPPSTLNTEPAVEETTTGQTGGPEQLDAASAEVRNLPQDTPGKLHWPVQGNIIRGFGVDNNTGINIAAPAGTPVRAVSSGTVAHAGNQARGFGNLVLIKHEDKKISIYGHLQQANVKVGDKVVAGQQIGTAGTSGGESQPQLYFALRQGKKPLDPTKHLE